MSIDTNPDAEPVVVGRGIHSKTVHQPADGHPVRPECWAVRKTDADWRRVDWAIVAPTHRRCANCFPDA